MNKDRNMTLIKLLGIFLLSTSLFVYEVLVTRLFSTILYYHFVFLTVSIAILGIGFGGIIIYKFKRNYSISLLSLILSLTYIICILIIYKLPFLDSFLFYAFLSSIPFVIGGAILSLLFLDGGSESNKLYFADLIGSTFGSILIIPMMDRLGFMVSVFVVSLIALIAAFLFASLKQEKKSKTVISFLVVIVLMLIVQKNYLNELERNFTSYITSTVTTIEHLRNENKDVDIVYSKWDSISRTDVIEEENNIKTVITDGGASAPMIQFDGNIESIEYLKDRVNYLPFALGDNQDVLLIGPGGGKDVLLALLGGSKNIDAVEINPSTIEAVKEFSEYNGDVYNLEGVNLVIDDGRSFVETTEKKYNNIYLGMVMTNAVSNGGMGLSENYIYTKEAYKAYFNHLKKDGYLSLMLHSANDTLRAINTGIEVLEEMGIARGEVKKHFVVINSMTNDMSEEHKKTISMPVLIFKKEPFTNEEIESIFIEINNQNRVIVNLPDIKYTDIYDAYSKGDIELNDLYEQFPVNIKPTIDDKPFFYDTSKGIPDVIKALLIGVAFIIAIGGYWAISRNRQITKSIIYFSLIGFGFMLIEIPLIQKSILFLGNPTRAFSYILFALLLSCGIGSYFSNKRIVNISIRGRQIIFILIPALTIVFQFILSTLINDLSSLDQVGKFIVLTAILFPLGFFMGMAFPKGIKKLNDSGFDNHIPLIWGVNGVMSVAGSAVALALSMTIGFTFTIIFGGLMYLAIFAFKLS
ncbi:hypothetical protein [Sporosalibacterium faouarense]|uniref:spermine/spermidine synthase domain-containing protein n=1 Tax=Sporosalibacterium faouarense TaxID=516123 RepID=UPI00141C3EFA|nr:hypothetical protein [Sporosalibacterium faouarense]MTI48540.1 hypothetical protein [Bacillota bacterium]